jgi:predicted transcriptional regulator
MAKSCHNNETRDACPIDGFLDVIMGVMKGCESPFANGMPIIEHDGDGRHIMVMPAVDNPGKLMELISLRKWLDDIAEKEVYAAGLKKILNGDESGIATLTETSRELMSKAAMNTKEMYQVELEQMPQGSPIVRAELAAVRAVADSDLLIWFTGMFKPGANLLGNVGEGLARLREKSAKILAIIDERNTKKNIRKFRKEITGRIAALKKEIPEDQHDLTELPLLRMPLDDVRALMAAKLAEKPAGAGKKRSNRQKRN